MENLLAGIFGLVIGIGGFCLGLYQLRNLAALRRWSRTSGKIIERGTYRVTTTATGSPAFRHAPLVRYVYRVDNIEYTSEDIHPKRVQAPEFRSRNWAEKRASSFAEEVTVYYNPAAPQEAYLLLTPKSKIYLLMIGSLAALLVGSAFLFARFV